MNKEISSSHEKSFKNEVKIQYRLTRRSNTESIVCFHSSSTKVYRQIVHLKPTISALYRKETIVIRPRFDDQSLYESFIEREIKPAQKIYVTVLYQSKQGNQPSTVGTKSFSKTTPTFHSSVANVRDPVIASSQSSSDENAVRDVNISEKRTIKFRHLDNGTFLQEDTMDNNTKSRKNTKSSSRNNQQTSRLISSRSKASPVEEPQFDGYSSGESASDGNTRTIKFSTPPSSDRDINEHDGSYDGHFDDSESPRTSSQMTGSSSFTIISETEEQPKTEIVKTKSSMPRNKVDMFIEDIIFIQHKSSLRKLQESHNWGPDPAQYMELLALDPGAFFVSVGYVNLF